MLYKNGPSVVLIYRLCYLWQHRFFQGVNSVLMLADGTLITGGNDRSVISWDSAKDFEKLVEVKLQDGVGSPRYLNLKF